MEMAQPSSRPPRTVTATSETSVDGLGQHGAETCPLCELPDVPFLHIFSYLRNEDGESLFAVAQACPRVSAFPSLWDGKKVNLGTSPRYFKTSIENLLKALRAARRVSFFLSESMWSMSNIEQEREDERSRGGEELSKDTHCYPLAHVDEVIQARSLALLRVAPPVDTLVLSNLCQESTSILRTYTYFETYAEFRSYSSSGFLRLFFNHPMDIASLIEKIGPTLKHLKSTVAVPLASLDHAQNLETLDLNVASIRVEAWPQPKYTITSLLAVASLSLPRLHTVRLGYDTDTASLDLDEALHSAELLLLALFAHCDQVRCVALCSPDVMPLLDACPADLQRLSICWPAPGLAARLGRMQGLKDLTIKLDDDEDDELESLLRACSGPLERLELVGMCRGETVRAVRAAGLTSLTSLVLSSWDPPDLRHVALALSGLPRLRLLDLENFSLSPEVVRDVVLAAIATLELLIIDDTREPELVTAVKELVTVVKELHVGLRLFVRDNAYTLFFRHSAAESECALCAEFAATVGSKGDERSARIEKCDVAE
ncbi:uncharacterized protein LOC113213176 [Frankliniella occidentalis]|uniref:Uncharacterized protein LOC113213176 n=1 Tax=Frankliniella occidentalis TaxID=133901 RepID=A0A6J1TB24_FRAOC|nr:uncharacterized protein LOC113213176 [Frankliniella occidentalis]XP_026287946.1 uncharacterized protein LOC113213176 [Frankliniella occidentalis]